MHDIMVAKAEVNCRVLYVLCKFSVNQNYRIPCTFTVTESADSGFNPLLRRPKGPQG